MDEFVAVTGVSHDEARFHLEAAGGNLEKALAAFFEEQQQESQSPEYSEPAVGSARLDGLAPTSQTGSSTGSPSNPAVARSTSGQPAASRVRTFQELLAGRSNDDDDEDDDEDENKEEPQSYFAGGGRSGLMMQGPPPDKKGAFDLVNDILGKAAKAGPPPEEFQKKEKKPTFFGGSGYRLGSGDEPVANQSQQPAPSASGSSAAQMQNAPPVPLEPVERHLTFWRNGFSIDDGPLLKYEDPANQEFLKAINSGRAPTTLLNVAYGQPVEVRVARKMDEDYKAPPKKPASAFSGTGARLGGIVPGDGSSAVQDTIPGAFPASSQSGPTAGSHTAPRAITVDNNLPTTSLQIRLADGTRMVAKFNHTHTIADVYAFVQSSRPAIEARPFIIQTTIPVRELKDMSLTLKDAGLLNAVVVQKFV
eukprot:jgi/Hompol1/4610/HPOL_000575-RA